MAATRKPALQGKVTLKRIAAEIGASISTVSYALSGRTSSARIAPDKIAEIKRTAERLGYRPNSAARSIRAGRFGAVALLLRERWGLNHLPGVLTNEIFQTLETAGQRMMVAHLPFSTQDLAGRGSSLQRELAVDGLLVTSNEQVPEGYEEAVDSLHLPVVWVNDRRGSHCVWPDEAAAAKAAVLRLAGLGHRRIGYVHLHWARSAAKYVALAHYSVRERRAGFLAGCAAAGVTGLEVIGADSNDFDGHLQGTLAALRAEGRPSALLGYSRYDAELVTAAARRLGLVIPRDLALTCFDDRQERCGELTQDTIEVPQADCGARAVGLLLERLANPALPARSLAIAHRHLPGATVAPPS